MKGGLEWGGGGKLRNGGHMTGGEEEVKVE